MAQTSGNLSGNMQPPPASGARFSVDVLGVFEVRGLLDLLQAQLLGQFILG